MIKNFIALYSEKAKDILSIYIKLIYVLDSCTGICFYYSSNEKLVFVFQVSLNIL